MPTRIVSFHRLAIRDVQRTHNRYFRQSPWAAGRFVQQFDDAVAKIEAAAESYAVESHNVRWLLLPNYPYIVRFQILDDYRCKIISVTHSSRRPGHWVGRLRRP